MEIPINSVEPNSLASSSIITQKDAHTRIAHFMGHAVEMVKQLKNQNQLVDITTNRTNEISQKILPQPQEAVAIAEENIKASPVDAIYDEALKEISQLKEKLAIGVGNAQAKEKVADLEKKLTTAKAHAAKNDQVVADLTQQLKQKIKEAQAKIELAQNEYDRKGKELLLSSFSVAKKTKWNKAAKEKLEQRVADIRRETGKLQSNLEAAKARAQESKKNVESLEQELSTAKTTLSNTDLGKKDIEKFKEELKTAEKEIAKIIHKAQIKVVSEIGAQACATICKEVKPEKIKGKIATLSQGGLSAKWIGFVATFSKTHRTAIKAFQRAQESMETASKDQTQLTPATTEVEKDKRAEFDNYVANKDSLKRRSGVIGLNGIYRVQVTFNKGKIKGQFKSFLEQNFSNVERTTITRQMTINERIYTSILVPLNKEFDALLGLRGTISNVFSKIFGSKGIASLNRKERHLINGWETNLQDSNGRTIFRALRHAITAAKNEKDPTIRKEFSKKVAEELLKAALLQEIADQGLTLAEASKKENLQLNFNSVSLVTPDDFRHVFPFLGPDELEMLSDQVVALDTFNGDQSFKLSLDDKTEYDIKVKVQANAFNFGVNQGAVVGMTPAKIKVGLGNQYEHNQKAMVGLRAQIKDFQEKTNGELQTLRNSKKTDDQTTQLIGNLELALKNAQQLMDDIETMMKDKKAYLEGDNQYEIGAKILNLSNVMNQAIEDINKTKVNKKDRLSGYKCAFNCMSGKDRTGEMDGIAKTFAIMAVQNKGIYYSHEDFKKPEVRKAFTELLVQVLLENGSLEITELNTGAKGYKVNKEARLFGYPLAEFLQTQGFSATTSS